jgi:tetratricopeptide (TPR) repeat protein
LSAQSPEPVGTLETALAHAGRLLEDRPALAEQQAREILKVVPGCAEAEMLLGLALAAQGAGPAAIAALRQAVEHDPGLGSAWRALGDQLALAGDETGAADAYARQIRASVRDPELVAAAAALVDNRLAVAERLLRDVLKARPTDVAAIRMLAEVAARLGRYDDAETLLERCLELAPTFEAARANYGAVLHRQNKPAEAIAQADLLLQSSPRHPGHHALKAAALVRIGEYEQAIGIYQRLLASHPNQPLGWMSYGHALKTVGRIEPSIEAYRESLRQLPRLGEAWWSLANLKTFRFDAADLEAMRAQLAGDGLTDEDRLHLHFALGKALEDAGDWVGSFEHYRQGNALRRAQLGYDPEETSAHVRRSKALFTADFFAERADAGCRAPDPIFVVGLPRAGSTLIEQILSSHSAVEGTMELPDILSIARRLGGPKRRDGPSAYPEALAELPREALAALGEEYLERTRVQRKLGRPFFVDKMPNNFAHLGLIHLILPRARVIDARRHPLGCCLSGFKQHFARGQGFTYDLEEIGRYYADYVELMAHFDEVLPGRVHRVIYEKMVADPEAEVRALLDYCGLQFEEGCLRFYETRRAVRTPSAEQVRQPIFSDGVDHWRNYEPWLEPLKAALGPVLEAYPEAPAF